MTSEQGPTKGGIVSDLYRGKPIESLTREEMIEALRTMARLYQEELEQDYEW